MLTYPLDERGHERKYEYLYRRIKEDILSGAISAGERLPSKRALAEHLGISVVTVENAYNQLLDEGYVEVRARSGFYVNHLQLPTASSGTLQPPHTHPESQESYGPAAQTILQAQLPVRETEASLPQDQMQMTLPSAHTPRSASVSAPAYSPEAAPSAPELEQSLPAKNTPTAEPADTAPDFPFGSFLRIVREVLNDYREQLPLRPPNAGSRELRSALSSYLKHYRGMQAKPEQIIIGSGSEYLYGLVAQLFDRRVVYAIEGQSYEKIRLIYSAYARPYELLPMDSCGVSSEGLQNSQAGVLHVTPFHSYPTGITAPAAKRYEYLAWAKKRSAFIVEDDYESEFAVLRKPLETMYAMDHSDSVIYLNTFTKSLAPSMRVGYMVLPERLLPVYQEKLGFYSCTVPSLDQYVLAEYIGRGYLERRLNRIRRKLRQAAES